SGIEGCRGYPTAIAIVDTVHEQPRLLLETRIVGRGTDTAQEEGVDEHRRGDIQAGIHRPELLQVGDSLLLESCTGESYRRNGHLRQRLCAFTCSDDDLRCSICSRGVFI